MLLEHPQAKQYLPSELRLMDAQTNDIMAFRLNLSQLRPALPLKT